MHPNVPAWIIEDLRRRREEREERDRARVELPAPLPPGPEGTGEDAPHRSGACIIELWS